MSDKGDRDVPKTENHCEHDGMSGQTAANRGPDDEGRSHVQHSDIGGYDLQMICDFLTHLILELRLKHYELLLQVKAQEATDTYDSLRNRVDEITMPPAYKSARNQLVDKYQAVLLPNTQFDCRNATPEEAKEFMMQYQMKTLAKRDEQLCHMEALKDLFEESLLCAAYGLGLNEDGKTVVPGVNVDIRKLAEETYLSGLPTYEELFPLFSDHFFATEEGIEFLKNHDPSIGLSAKNESYDHSLMMYGAVASTTAIEIPIGSFRELQFVLTAIRKFVGIPCTDGREWKDLDS